MVIFLGLFHTHDELFLCLVFCLGSLDQCVQKFFVFSGSHVSDFLELLSGLTVLYADGIWWYDGEVNVFESRLDLFVGCCILSFGFELSQA